MNDIEHTKDLLLSAALKGARRTMPVDDEFTARLLRATRRRSTWRRWAAAASVAVCSLFGVLAATGVLPLPRFKARPVGEGGGSVRVGVATPVSVPVAVKPKRRSRQSPAESDEVNRAIGNALDYLVAQQREDGSFPGPYGDSAAIPSLVGMAILSRGSLLDDERYGATLAKCVDYVVSLADLTDAAKFPGYFGGKGNGRMYAHSIATLFLSECSGMVDRERQERLDVVLPLAVKVIVDAQNQRKDDHHFGGWRYTPDARDSDLSCSGWALMALKSARLNGAAVPVSAIEKAVLYIRRAYRDSDGSFGYQGANGQHGDTLSGAAILSLELCGRHLEKESLKAADFLKSRYQRTLAGPNGNSYYALYYTAQGLFQIGGEHWREFEPWMYENYLKRQTADGSWPGDGVRSQIYSTAMTVLAFTVPYRMLPIYQRDETVDY